MTSITRLCGPPEIHHRPPPSAAADGGDGETTEMATEIDTLSSQTTDLTLADIIAASTKPPLGFTENNSLTYLATGNPCLDFFFHVVKHIPSDELIGRLKSSWSHDPLTTLKLICNLRGVRGTGKSDRENFYTAALWLHRHHPKTLACNAAVFADFGYFKDLLEILYRILEGDEARSKAKGEWKMRKRMAMRKQRWGGKRGSKRSHKKEVETKRKLRASVPILKRVEANMEKVNEEREKARALRKERECSLAQRALERYGSDPDYQFLHDRVSDLFSDLLKSDLQRLNDGELGKISLAAKWCPTIDSSYDKSTLICESIARKIFPKNGGGDPEYESIEEAHYAYRVRDRLRRDVLVPLHKALQLPEVYMSANQWRLLPYKRVASVAMRNYKNIFVDHDEERFNQYLNDVKSGKEKIAAGALLPHEIVAQLRGPDGGKVAELQWARMVDDLSNKGKLRNCIAVCDVSGSMMGEPMEVCVSLGLLISELSEEPWKGNVITFSANPQLHKVSGDSLLEKTEFIRRMEMGANTNFQAVFDRILEVAVAGKLSEEQMIKRVFVFSDMEFDEASGRYSYGYDFCGYTYNNGLDSEGDYTSDSSDNEECRDGNSFPRNGNRGDEMREKGWETDYEVIQRKFRESGYSKVPEIVFWNLRYSQATPVTAKQSGVALVSGFSKNMVTIFFENDGLVNPEVVMEQAIAGEQYQKLVVYD